MSPKIFDPDINILVWGPELLTREKVKTSVTYSKWPCSNNICFYELLKLLTRTSLFGLYREWDWPFLAQPVLFDFHWVLRDVGGAASWRFGMHINWHVKRPEYPFAFDRQTSGKETEPHHHQTVTTTVSRLWTCANGGFTYGFRCSFNVDSRCYSRGSNLLVVKRVRPLQVELEPRGWTFCYLEDLRRFMHASDHVCI